MRPLTTTQLAERWGMNPGTLRIWRSKCKGPPYIRIGGGKKPRIRYRIGDVKDYERRHRIKPKGKS